MTYTYHHGVVKHYNKSTNLIVMVGFVHYCNKKRVKFSILPFDALYLLLQSSLKYLINSFALIFNHLEEIMACNGRHDKDVD